MRFLGVDYGEKRIGLALSDEEGRLAFPKEIIINDKNVFEKIRDIIKKEIVGSIVVGESVNARGEPNPIDEKIKSFISGLEKEFGLPVYSEKEFFTSVEARRYMPSPELADASAAALILQRYLDKIKK